MSRAALLLLADGRFPAGGHAHSGGVEAAVAHKAVHDTPSLEAFCRGRLHTTGLTAAGLAAAAAAGSTHCCWTTPPTRHPRPRTARRRPSARPADDARSPCHLPVRSLGTAGRRAPHGAHQPIVLGLAARAAGLTPRTPPMPPRTRTPAARPQRQCAC